MAHPALDLRGIEKSFGNPVLTGVDLTVAAGEAVGVIGPNGAGKSTLLNIASGEIEADAGSIMFDGEDVTAAPSHTRCRRGLACTAQIPRPFERLTVFENVLVAAVFGHAQRRSERVAAGPAAAAIEQTGLADLANTPAGELRLLDRRRLELARALGTQPRVLLLDEIAGGLTEGEVHLLIDEILKLNAAGITILWIEHIVHALTAVVDRLIAIADGIVVADGDPAEVLADERVQQVYIGVG
ncbi:MAG: ATP-binding cassette domain-containing protein [Actinomycetota bacterium]